MKQHKEQKNTANDLCKYDELHQKSLTLLKIIGYIKNNVAHIKFIIVESAVDNMNQIYTLQN